MSSKTKVSPPIAAQVPHKVVFGKVEGENRGLKPFEKQRFRDDNWYWLRSDDRKDEKVLDHLKLENSYAEQETKHLEGLRKELYDEHISHLKETDEKPAFRHGNFFYYSRTVQGLSYKISCRKPIKGDERLPLKDAAEVVLLDENLVAKGKKHCDITSVKPSVDHEMLAYCADFSGDEVYDLFVKEIAGSEPAKAEVPQVAGLLQWGGNNVLFYLKQDSTLRPYRLYSHVLGTDPKDDKLLFEELDGQYWVHIGKSLSGRFLFLHSESSETSEIHFIDLEADKHELKCLSPRKFGLRYAVEHDGSDGFYISTNIREAVNNRLMHAPITKCAPENWKEVLDYDPSRKIDSVEVFSKHVVIGGRQGGLSQLWIVDQSNGRLDKNSFRKMEFDEEIYDVDLSTNKVFDTKYVRITYSSPTTPVQWIDRDMTTTKSDAHLLIKEQPVLNFDRKNYACQRLYATAADKTKVPISMVYHKSLLKDLGKKPVPCMLYGYGSYGVCVDPRFNGLVLPYLDRGVLYCIAHIRGGGEMGQHWYEEEGKYLNKRNTFSDFISCAEFLVDNNYTSPEILACEGRSAGGLLMGNVVNMRPDLFQVAVAGVPFVDLMNTMCDPSIPLTTSEWEEWGNPNEDKYFDYMLSYSPYDNVREQPYPNILITAGLHDPRVAYWEPAKWASKLRSMKTDSNVVVAKFDIDSGHFSASDRYAYLTEKSYDQAFVLDKIGLGKASKL